MAGSSGGENEKADSWRRLRDADKLDFERVLLKLGLHVDSPLLSVTEVRLDDLPFNILEDDDLRCLFLAVVGRGSFQTKTLDLTSRYDELTEDNAEALCVNLRSNRNVQSLYLNYQDVFGTPRGCTLMADALKAESAIEKLTLCNNYMSAEAVKNLMDGLQEGKGKTLKYLSLSCNDIFDEGVESVANMLETNTSLKHLEMHATGAGFLGAERMSHALAINSTLEHLSFGYNRIGQKGMEALVTALKNKTPDAGPKNKTLKELVLNDMKRKDLAVDSLTSMIRNNDTLRHLRLEGARFYSKDWVEKIIPALQQNATLKELNLSEAHGLDSGAFDALKGLVSSSSSKSVLDKIILDNTDLSMKVAVINEELRINREYRTTLREAEAKYVSEVGSEIAREESKNTNGRLVFCGSEYAGKSTIFKTMITIAQERRPKEATGKLKEVWGKAKKKLPIDLRKHTFSERTRGIDIEIIVKEPNRVVLWDFAGQQEYHALHDYVFPNVKNSCFLYVCSPTSPPPPDPRKGGKFKEQDDMREDFTYWMKFIASNSKQVQKKEGNAGLPRVTFVLTFKDKLSSIGKLDVFKLWAEEIVEDLQKEFYGVITLGDTVEVVNAHDKVDVENLQILMLEGLNDLLANSTEIAAAACNVVRRALVQWGKENKKKPILHFTGFRTQCDNELRRTMKKVGRMDANSDAQVEPLDPGDTNRYNNAIAAKAASDVLSTDAGKKMVLAYLSDVGEIIFHEGMDFLIVNPKWFGVNILGALVDVFETRAAEQAKVLVYCKHLFGHIFQRASSLKHDQGFFKEDDIKKFLSTNLKSLMSSEQMLNLLKHLDMCFPAPGLKVFVPAVLVKKRDKATTRKRKLSWTLPNESAGHGVDSESIIYVGRRLECENQSQAFITPAIFPRMQVSMQNYLDGRESSKEGIIIERNLIYFADGQNIEGRKKKEIEVWVEYSGDDCVDSYVDVLVCSSMAFEVTVHFLEVHVLRRFKEICASPQGCPGVVLVEAAISPTCVKNIGKCGDRKNYAFRLLDLQDRLRTDKTYQHFWSESQSAQSTDTAESSGGAPISDFGLDLLQGEGTLNRMLSKQVHAKLAHHVQQQHVARMRKATSIASISQRPPLYPADYAFRLFDRQDRLHTDETYEPLWSESQSGQSTDTAESSGGISISNFGLDWLQGEGAFHPAVQKSAPLPYEIPILIINLENPNPGTFLKKLMARLINPDEKIRIKVYLMCCGAHGSHTVKDQKGQILDLTFKDSSLLMKYAAAGIIMGGVIAKQFIAADSRYINVKMLDKLIKDLFGNTQQELQVDTMELLGGLSDVDIKDSRELSDVELLTLMVNCFNDKSSDQSWLDSVLRFNDEDENFRKDFELWKVEYSASKCLELETPIGWLCKEHYDLGIAQKIFKGFQ